MIIYHLHDLHHKNCICNKYKDSFIYHRSSFCGHFIIENRCTWSNKKCTSKYKPSINIYNTVFISPSTVLKHCKSSNHI